MVPQHELPGRDITLCVIRNFSLALGSVVRLLVYLGYNVYDPYERKRLQFKQEAWLARIQG